MRAISADVASRNAVKAGAERPDRAANGAAITGAAAAIILYICLYPAMDRFAPGALTHHMISHIWLMSAVAPLIAALLPAGVFNSARALAAAGIAQTVLFYAWHSPPGIAAASTPGAAFLMHGSLLLAATVFWACVMSQAMKRPASTILALILTGKLFCLMAALWVFSKRTLFETAGHHGHLAGANLDDQHLAGLIMLVACPTIYVGAAILIFTRWLSGFDRSPV